MSQSALRVRRRIKIDDIGGQVETRFRSFASYVLNIFSFSVPHFRVLTKKLSRRKMIATTVYAVASPTFRVNDFSRRVVDVWRKTMLMSTARACEFVYTAVVPLQRISIVVHKKKPINVRPMSVRSLYK